MEQLGRAHFEQAAAGLTPVTSIYDALKLVQNTVSVALP
jgi:hypothetical protein